MKNLVLSAIAFLAITSTLACSKSQTSSPASAPTETAVADTQFVQMGDSGASGDKRRILAENLPGSVNVPESQFSSNEGLYDVDCTFKKDVATKCTASTTSDGASPVDLSDEQARAVGYVFMSNIGDKDKGVAGAAEIKAGFVACNESGDEAEIKNIAVRFYPNRHRNQSYSPEFFRLEREIGYNPY